MFLKNKKSVGLSLVALLLSVQAAATPITYTFTTSLFGGDQPGYVTNGIYQSISADAYVSGSFTYDADRPSTGAAPSLTSAGPLGASYQTFDNLQGTLHTGGSSYAFGNASGLAEAYNEGYSQYGFVNLDVLRLAAGPLMTWAPAPPMDTGFTLNNLPLFGVEMRWMEQNIGDAPDFLASNALPNSLPSAAGRFGIAFARPNAPLGFFEYASFEGLKVAPASVPEPGTQMIFLSGLVFLFSSRRFRKRAN